MSGGRRDRLTKVLADANHRSKAARLRPTNMRSALALSSPPTPTAWAIALLCTLGCSPAAPTQSGDTHLSGGEAGKMRRAPPKPGESITHTQMCSCKVCEPASCCRELEQDAPEMQPCADGLDFSNCQMEVSSCDTRCFQHRWRTHIEIGCAGSRPDKCCHDQSEM